MTNKSKTSEGRMSRREFARGGALTVGAAAASASLPAALLADNATAMAQESGAGQIPAQQPALTTVSQDEVNGKVASVMRRYGNLLSDAEKLDVRRLITEGQKPLEQMRDFALHLENSDQPGNVLRLYPDPAPSMPKTAAKTPTKSVKK